MWASLGLMFKCRVVYSENLHGVHQEALLLCAERSHDTTSRYPLGCVSDLFDSLLYASTFLIPSVLLSLGAKELALSSQHLFHSTGAYSLGPHLPWGREVGFLPKALSAHFSRPHERCGLSPKDGNGGRFGTGERLGFHLSGFLATHGWVKILS